MSAEPSLHVVSDVPKDAHDAELGAWERLQRECSEIIALHLFERLSALDHAWETGSSVTDRINHAVASENLAQAEPSA